MTEAATGVSEHVLSAETRSTLYQGLALGWRYPDRPGYEAYQSGQYTEELLEFATSLPHLAALVAQEAATPEQVRGELKNLPFEEFEVRYVSTFDVGFPEPPCPPYEGLYNKKMERAQAMVEISEFYRQFGLKMNQAPDKRELPDYLVAELEFLAFLAFKEAQAAYEGTAELLDGYRRAQKDFLERHMVDWLPEFAARLEEEEALPFFPHLLRFTIGFTRAELVRTLAGPDVSDEAGSAEPAAQAATDLPVL
jgi:DMSO reductase family type II enzyme chaperone